MRRLTISVDIAFGRDEPEVDYREGQSDALVERAEPYPNPTHELDARPIGFRQETT